MKSLLILITIFLIPFVYGNICEDTLDLSEYSDCLMITPTLTCTNYTYDIIDATDYNIIRNNYNLTLLNNSIYFFNFTEGQGNYVINLCDSSTREIIVIREGEKMQLAMIIGIGILAAILLYIGFSLDKDHNLLKLLHIFFALFLLLLIPSSLINGVIATQDNFLRIMIWILRIFITYLFIYFNYVIWFKTQLLNWGIISKNK